MTLKMFNRTMTEIGTPTSQRMTDFMVSLLVEFAFPGETVAVFS